MRKILNVFLLTFAILVGINLGNCMQANASTNTDFITKLTPAVKKASKENGLYASVMMAQAIVESNWGNSKLSLDANNYFGIKGSYNGNSVTMQTDEENSDGSRYTIDADFKKYGSVEQSINDNAQLLRNGTSYDNDYYSGTWKENALNYSDAAIALSVKYATDIEYGYKIIRIIEQYDLDKLDSGNDTTNINKQIQKGLDSQFTSEKTSSESTPEDTSIESHPNSLKNVSGYKLISLKDKKEKTSKDLTWVLSDVTSAWLLRGW